MSFLETIPTEISSEILFHFSPQALARLSCLSHRMHALCIPLLYRSIKVEGNISPSQSSLQMILRSFLSPSGETLASCVRALDLNWDSDDIDLRRKVPLDILLFKSGAISRGVTRPIMTNPAQFLLLLHLLHGLHSLTIAPPLGTPGALGEILGSLYTTGLSHPSRAPACLRFLREFHVPAIPLPTKALLAILQLPCIRTVDFFLSGDSSIGIRTIAAAAHTSSVTDLRIAPLNICAKTLLHVIQIPTRLTSLSFRATWGCVLFEVPNFDQLLQSQRGSLRHLAADLSKIVQYSGATRVPAVIRLGAYYEWPALQSVSTSISSLLGRTEERVGRRLVDVLPRRLQLLDVQRDEFSTVQQETEALIQLLKDETAVPALRKLVVRHGGVVELGLLGVCEAAGVALVDEGE